MMEIYRGVYIGKTAPRHCPGCGARLARGLAEPQAAHDREHVPGGWLVACHALRSVDGSALVAPPLAGVRYHPRSGKAR